jgi:hypothetical protein
LDTTPGNSGGAFRRTGDLDIRALNSSGWAVTNTAPGEWIEFDDVDLSAGNYRFAADYATGGSTATGDGPRIELLLDGAKFAPVILAKTANADSFATTLLGQQTVDHGEHTLRLRFLDGLVDLDWLFIEKVDKGVDLRAESGSYVTARLAGGGDLAYDATTANVWETFTFDDLNGGDLADGDAIYVQTYNGLYMAMTANHAVQADQRQPSDAARFTIRMQGGSLFAAGAKLALETSDSHYLTAAPGNIMDVSGTSIGPAQTFTLGY